MHLRGEFHRADGLVIPNNITTFGARALLAMGFRGEACTLSVGLCSGVYDPDLVIGDLVEPTTTNGYARIALARNATDWPTEDSLNGEEYAESKNVFWTASGGNFSAPITRLFLFMVSSDFTGGIFGLSAALPEPLLITPTTPLGERTFRYRVYLR